MVSLFVAPPRSSGTVKEFQRKQLVERVGRDGATVGASIPERITVQGEAVDLREFVFEVKRRETVPPGEHDRVERAKRNLRRERRERMRRLEDEDVAETITYREGEALVESIVGIDRALNALESLDPTDLEAEAEARDTADRKRWVTFLQEVLGHDDGGPRTRP